MTEFQNRVYTGLMAIGPEIANFFMDSLRLLDSTCSLASKANLIAHLAREIDSSFREVFTSPAEEKLKKAVVGKDRGHYASILVALGKEPNDPLADKWEAIAKEFPRIAHHKRAYLPTKAIDEIESLWTEYEKVLNALVGSFYGISERLSQIASLPIPTLDALNTLKNMLFHPTNQRYFFLNLAQEGWLFPLFQEGYFAIETAPPKPLEAYGAHRWPQLSYLLTIAPNKKDRQSAEAYVYILENIVNAYLTDVIYLDQFMISTIAKIHVDSNEARFTLLSKQLFQKAALTSGDAHLFYTATLSEELPIKIIDLQDAESLQHLLDYLFGFSIYYENEEQFRELGYSPIGRLMENVDLMHLESFARKFGRETVNLLQTDAINILLEKIRDLETAEPMKLSSLSIPSIELSEQTQFSPMEWETKLIEILVNSLGHLNQNDLSQFIQDFISSNIQILNRISFHIIREKYTILSNIFWTFITTTRLTDAICLHEIYLLIEQHSPNFNNDQFRSLTSWIENKEKTSLEGETDVVNDHLHYHMIRRCLSSLHPSSKEQILKLNDIRTFYDTKDNTPLAHPSFDSHTSFTPGYDIPIQHEKFDQMPVEEQATYCAELKQKYAHDTTEEGLGSLLSTCIAKTPMKYYYTLDLFSELPSIYIHNILYGFTIAIRNDLLPDYSLLIIFVKRTVQSDRFRQNDNAKFNTWRWVATGIADLFSTIANRRNRFSIKEDDINLFNNILLQLLTDDRFTDRSDKMNGDATTHLLNSAQGKLHTALLDCTLMGAELFRQEHPRKWPGYVADYFSSRLQHQERADKDFSIAVGYYLDSLIFLDANWADEKYPLIFNTANDAHQRYTLAGCFTIYRQVTPSLYDYFKRHDTFLLALSINETANAYLDAIMRYCLWEWRYRKIPPEADTSIFKFIINQQNVLHIQRLVQVTRELRILDREQILTAWSLILHVSSVDHQAFNGVFHSLIGFLELYQTLDFHVAPMIKKSIRVFTEMGPAPNYLIRLLCKYGSSDLAIAADLLLDTIHTINALPYANEDFLRLMESLYQNNLKDKADAIALFFADKGSLYLKSLFERYTIIA